MKNEENMGSTFAGIDDVTVSESLPYIQPGSYVFDLDRMLVGNSSRPGKGEFFVAEFTVQSSTRADCPPGTRLGWPIFLNKGEISLVNIKAMMTALLQCGQEKITSKVLDKAVDGDGTALAGRSVVCQAVSSTTKKGNPFTKMSWQAHTDQQFAPVGGAVSDSVSQADGFADDDDLPF
jgi:hypothetical protein